MIGRTRSHTHLLSRRTVWISALLAMLFLCIPARLQARPLKKDPGLTLLDQGRYDDAIAWAQQRIRENPYDYDARNKAGVAYLRKARKNPAFLNQASLHFHEAARIDPLNALTHYQLGQVFIRMNKPRDAVVELRKTTLLAPEFVAGHMSLAAAYFRAGDPLRGAAALREAAARNPDYAREYTQEKERMEQHMRTARFLALRQVHGRIKSVLLWAGSPGAVTAAQAGRVAMVFALLCCCLVASGILNRGRTA